ncbi:MAG: Undecaprenyl-diphosphatase [Candidatus Woesebacteria bacterium GW2011_GWB1_38_8]|uniref:Undecaprenyl-diphosphatase n=1 Tax=Candidatus Woesebacteria bacterium GW2011_GWB1_38_8 TaxID=1618570 RepID=A0A0G0L9T3_9BACT|nr:MAG: Undecaprenyl-diphosphatase [Candidatus Woesebacteria bacterium GW2011_GWB1_38_8]
MNIVWATVLGLIQGLTEFLPVSSSGHLVIAQHFIPGFTQPGILFDVVLHLATLLAVLFFYRNRIFTLGRKYYQLLLIGTIPAATIGFLFQSQLENTFGDFKMVGVELIITGILNFLIDRTKTVHKNINYSNSFLIGISQAIAIIPGISRSGATIFSGVKLGIDRQKAAEFSFLLSIPAILGANVLQVISHGNNIIGNPIYYFAGFVAAFIGGFFSINLVLTSLAKRRFSLFGYYCIAIGLIVLLI